MKNWRSVVGALCIVVALMLGAFAGFAYARPGVVGASPNAGTRGEDRRLVSAFDEQQKALEAGSTTGLAVKDNSGPQSLVDTQPLEITAPGGATAKRVSPEEQRDAQRQQQEYKIKSDHGTITLRHE